MPTPLEYGHAGERAYSGYYRHSGRLPVWGVAVALGAGVPVGVGLGIAYAYAVVFLPFVLAHLMLALLYGSLLGAVAAGIVRRVGGRSVAVTLAITAAITLVSYYASWAGWLHLVIERGGKAVPIWELLSRPVATVGLIDWYSRQGIWALTGEPSDRPIVLFCWAVEAVLIFGVALWTARGRASDVPYCEACKRWCVAAVLPNLRRPEDLGEIRRRMEAGDFDYLIGLGRREADAIAWIEPVHHSCPTCGGVNTLTLSEVHLEKGPKGLVGRSEKVIVNKLVVDAEVVGRLRGLA